MNRDQIDELAIIEHDRIDIFPLYIKCRSTRDAKLIKEYWELEELCYLTVIGSY